MKTRWHWLWQLYRRQAPALLAATMLSLLTAIAGIGLLGVSGWFLTATALLTTQPGAFNLFVPSASIRALAFTRILSRYAERLLGHTATLRLLSDLRVQVFSRLLCLAPGQTVHWRDGDLVARLTHDIDTIDHFFLLAILPWLTGLLASIATVAVLAAFIPPAALVIAAMALFMLVPVPLCLVRQVRQSGAARQDCSATIHHQVLEASEGLADLQALNAGRRAGQAMAAASQAMQQAGQGESRAFAAGQALLLAASGTGMLLVIVLGMPALHAGQISAAVLAGCVLAVLGLFEVLLPVLRGASRMGAAMAAASRIREIDALRPAVTASNHPTPLAPVASLRFHQLTFRYLPDQPLIEGVNLEVAPGQRVVISGASGSGKSTLLALLLRLLEADSGRICWGDVDIRDASLDALHQRIALLSQDSPVFLGTVRTNLCIADPDADDARLWSVLAQAGLADEIRALPEGLDQWLGEGGRTLSVGQARRLCLARVLLSQASLLVLDEPTEGLDADTEQAFLRDLPQLLQGRSLLLVTHADVPDGVADISWHMADGQLA